MGKTKANGFEYVACYVDDVICFSKEPKKILEHLSRFYTLKGVGNVEFFLGADLIELNRGVIVDPGLSRGSVRSIRNSYAGVLAASWFGLRPSSGPFANQYLRFW